MMRPPRRAPALRLGIALLLAAVLGQGGCASPPPGPRDEVNVSVLQPLADRRLERLALDFYGRLANRRIDSIATYQDPSLREYFRSEDAFADYYADLVQHLVDHYFEARRLTAVEIQGFAPDEEGGVLTVRLRGENGRPLRWWSTEVVREDRWVRGAEGRWWIQPGKV